ncbi:MAG: alcohol dehydrogenase [Clostridia bacterium]|jgi:alcohol dehydrogenase|nr:iron-containing alcohol dehydrogenase [Clostridiales bacterium]MDK2985902.1 alcohol dehydrogenase [Clostridia bacterium]
MANIFKGPSIVMTGYNSIENLKEVMEWFKCKKPIIITDAGIVKAGLAERIYNIIKEFGLTVDIYSEIESDPSIETAEKCSNFVKQGGYDFILALGGGSPIDIAKVASIMMTNEGEVSDFLGIEKVPNRGLPKIIIPTTAGTGSEVTNVSVLSIPDKKTKKGIVSRYLFADVAIIDSSLMLTIPANVTASTGMDALTHAIEAYISRFSTPWTDMYALKSISLIGKYLRRAVVDGKNIEARENMAIASTYAGLAFGNAATGMVHGIAMSLGGQCHVPHGIANAIMLPYVMEWNSVSSFEKFKQIAIALGENTEGLSDKKAAEKAVTAVRDLSIDIGIPQNLRSLSIKDTDLEELARDAMTNERQIKPNPRDVSYDEVLNILKKAL